VDGKSRTFAVGGVSFLFAGDGRQSPSGHPSGKDRLAFEVAVMEPPRDHGSDQPRWRTGEKYCADAGNSRVEIDKKIALIAADLRDPFGIIVAARSAGASVEVPLNAGDVIRAR